MGIANKVYDFFDFWYYQYILVTALYMLEFWERAVFNVADCFLLAFIAMASYTAYVFLPGDIVMLTHFLQYLAGTRSEAEL